MPDKSNKKLPITRLTQLLKVIKNYCLQDFCPGLFEMLEPMRKHRQSVASTGSQSQAQAESQSQAHDQCARTNHSQCTGSA